MFVHIPKYNYSYKCTNLLKTVLYMYIIIITQIKVNTHKYSNKCTYKQNIITLIIVCKHVSSYFNHL